MRNFARPLRRIAQGQVRLAIVQQADAAQRRGDWQEAARLYSKELEHSPERTDLLVQLGHCYKECGQYRLSYDCYLRALGRDAYNDDPYLHMGHLLKITGNIYCAARFYDAARRLHNGDARKEYENIANISTPPRFSFNNRVAFDTAKDGDGAGRDWPALSRVLGALELCEVRASAVERLREAARLLAAAGVIEWARSFFEMSFIREGFGPIARRNSFEFALRNARWDKGGPRFPHPTAASAARGAVPVGQRAVVRWLIEQFRDDSAGTSSPDPAEQGASPLAPPWIARPTHAAPLGPDALSAHAIIAPEQVASTGPLVSRLCESLATGATADNWTELQTVMADLERLVANAGGPLVSFDTGNIRDDVETHAARVLFNNLYDFVCEHAPIMVGPLASPRVLAVVSRFEGPLLAPYLGENSALCAEPGELIGEIARELGRSQYEPDDPSRRAALGRLIALTGARLAGDHALQLLAVAVDGSLTDAIAELLPRLVWRHGDNIDFMVRLSQTLKHGGYFHWARDILEAIPAREPLQPGSAEFGMLVERGIVEKICGNFGEAARIFSDCLAHDPQNQFLREELLAVLPEAADMEEVLKRVNADPELLALARRRRLYRLHTDGWAAHAVQNGDGSAADADEIVLELLPAAVKPFSTAGDGPGSQQRIDLLQLGRERRSSQWGDLPVLRGIEAIRVRISSPIALVAMRVRFDGRTVCVEPARSPVAGVDRHDYYIFNAWVDCSALRPGLHELQLYFEERAGGYRIREELVFVDRPMPLCAEAARSGAVVRLDRANANSPLDERINALPSVVYPARRRFCDTPLSHVLVVRADQLGDFVVSMPAIRRLKELLPDARFYGLVSPSATEVARTTGCFDELIEVAMTYDPIEGRRYLPPHEQIELRRRLKQYAFDLAIDLSTGSDTRPLLRLSGAPVKVGFRPHEFPWLSFGIDAVTRDVVNGREKAPHGTMMTMLVEAFGALLREPPAAQMRTAQAARQDGDPGAAVRLRRFGIEEGERYLLLHSGARLLMKRWPLAHYCELARLALAATDLKVVMLVDDAERMPEIEAAGLPPERFCAVAGPLPFADLDALVAHCAVMVGNDSGPKHFAAARGAKVVSVHMGQVNWQEWGQEGDGLIVTRHVPCYGCGIVEAHECGKDLACLVHIRPAEVFAAVSRLYLLSRRTRAYRARSVQNMY